MANINEILARAAALRNETALNSIDPERAGGIMYDTLLALNELWLQQGAALVISKIYASVAAMNADTSPVSDLTGNPIRPGMIVVIASSDSDNGSVYRYNGTSSPRWSLVGKIGNITPEDSLNSDSTQIPLAAHQGKVLDGKISQLGQEKIDKNKAVGFAWNNSDFEQGSIDPTTGNNQVNATRIRTIDKQGFQAGDKINIVIGQGQKVIIGTYINGNYSASSWFTTDFEYTVESDCNIRILVAFIDNTNITPSDNECVFFFNKEVLNKIEDEIEESEKRSLSYVWTNNDFEQGTINPSTGENASSSIRIRTKEKKAFSAGDRFYVNFGTNQRVIIGVYDNGGYSAISLTESKYYNVQSDCEIRLIVADWDDSAITPSDNLCTFFFCYEIIEKIEGEIDEKVDSLKDEIGGVVSRNKEKNNRLIAASVDGKLLQFCLCTDVHKDVQRFRNSVLVTQGFKSIFGLLGLGDFVRDSMYDRTDADYIFEQSQDLTKPFLLILGNHDVGNTVGIQYTITNAQAYNIFFSPLHERGFLNDTENTPGTCYWFKDFADTKIRLIGLNCYDEDIQLNETLWEAIEYDSTNPYVRENTTYQSGDIVRVLNYTEHSFKAKSTFTTGSDFRAASANGPQYKCKRGTFVIGETQANWLADKLATTPSGYGIVIALHGAFSPNCTNQSQLKFANRAIMYETADPGSHYMMETDMLAGLIDAYMNNTIYDADIKMTGAAGYMNTRGSEGNMYAYHITKDFSNANGKFVCWLGGHTHKDLVWKHNTYIHQYQIAPTWTNELLWYYYSGQDPTQKTDIATSQENDIANDCLTVVAFNPDEQKINLCKIGQDMTTMGVHRDYEIIDINP